MVEAGLMAAAVIVGGIGSGGGNNVKGEVEMLGLRRGADVVEVGLEAMLEPIVALSCCKMLLSKRWLVVVMILVMVTVVIVALMWLT